MAKFIKLSLTSKNSDKSEIIYLNIDKIFMLKDRGLNNCCEIYFDSNFADNPFTDDKIMIVNQPYNKVVEMIKKQTQG